MHVHTAARGIYGIFLAGIAGTPRQPEAERSPAVRRSRCGSGWPGLALPGGVRRHRSRPRRAGSGRRRRVGPRCPGCTRSPLTKVPLVDPSSRIVARPPSSTMTVACRRDTLSYWPNAAATRDCAGSRPRITEVPAGTSTFPVGNAIRSTTRDGRRRAPGNGCRHCMQTTSAGSWTGVPQFGQIALLSPAGCTAATPSATGCRRLGTGRAAGWRHTGSRSDPPAAPRCRSLGRSGSPSPRSKAVSRCQLPYRPSASWL